MSVVSENAALLKVGDAYGNWRVLGVEFYLPVPAGRRTARIRHVVAECDCGAVRCLNVASLKYGRSLSCGCLHGPQRLPSMPLKGRPLVRKLIRKLNHIKGRCYNPRAERFKNYGARGITICSEWMACPMAFVQWAMSNGYRPELSLDRKDNDGPYSPGNCQWSDAATQNNNKRTSRRITAFGETKTIAQWSADARCMISQVALRNRVRCGWDADLAITLPLYAGHFRKLAAIG